MPLATVMTNDTLEIEGNSFVAMALRHGLLKRHHVDKILEHARRENVRPSDAALSLSMLEMYEVDAINLLSRPTELAPGFELTGLIGCGAGGMVFRGSPGGTRARGRRENHQPSFAHVDQRIANSA